MPVWAPDPPGIHPSPTFLEGTRSHKNEKPFLRERTKLTTVRLIPELVLLAGCGAVLHHQA